MIGMTQKGISHAIVLASLNLTGCEKQTIKVLTTLILSLGNVPLSLEVGLCHGMLGNILICFSKRLFTDKKIDGYPSFTANN